MLNIQKRYILYLSAALRCTKETGTIVEKKIEKCTLDKTKITTKKLRKRISMKKSNDIFLVRWNNNNIVTLASNFYGFQLFIKVKRMPYINKKTKS